MANKKPAASTATVEKANKASDETALGLQRGTAPIADPATAPTPDPEAVEAAANPPLGDEEPKLVELADKDTGFFDPVTRFQVVRDQQVELSGKTGDATQEALNSGRLLIVGT